MERSLVLLKEEGAVGLLVPSREAVEEGVQRCEEGVGEVDHHGRVEVGVLVSSVHSSQPLHHPSSQ